MMMRIIDEFDGQNGWSLKKEEEISEEEATKCNGNLSIFSGN